MIRLISKEDYNSIFLLLNQLTESPNIDREIFNNIVLNLKDNHNIFVYILDNKVVGCITLLIEQNLTIAQTFYYASLIHLILVLIHPYADGNGRTARLAEKWFLSTKLGENAWGINSEKLYLKRNRSYHKNINRVGSNYENIDYSYSIPFLKMLPMALRIKS